MNKSFWVIFLVSSFLVGQTFFTVPRSVWRFSMTNHVGSGNWIGSGGLLDKGIRDIEFRDPDSTIAALVHRTSKIGFNRRDIKIEFGLSPRMTFRLHVPSYSSFTEKIDWSKKIEVDSLTTNLDSLMEFYYPEKKSSSGLGDATLGMDVFGEFFKYFNERLVNITWRIERANYSREVVNTPVSFLWGTETNPDSIIALIGKTYLRQLGDELLLSAMGKLELWPDRISITGGINSIRTQKDFVYSNDPSWDSWMVSRQRDGKIVHDTHKTQIRQYVLVTLHNVHPTKSIGPVQFDIEFGASFPYFTRHTYSFASAWLGMQAYFQAW